jgi:hypothetical protein
VPTLESTEPVVFEFLYDTDDMRLVTIKANITAEIPQVATEEAAKVEISALDSISDKFEKLDPAIRIDLDKTSNFKGGEFKIAAKPG